MTRTARRSDPPHCRPSVEAALRRDPVVWLSSVQSDGRPHLVPVWFHWDGERIVAFSKPHARKVDNLRDRPSVMAGGRRSGAGLRRRADRGHCRAAGARRRHGNVT